MNGELSVVNRQRFRKVDGKFLQTIVLHLVENVLKHSDYDLTIQLLSAKQMAELNQSSLGHEGSTDVITFDFSGKPPLPALAGELFICVEEAVRQSALFKTDWQTELTRYTVHGILHLEGYDDLKPALRKRMKQVENRLVGKLKREFHLRKLQVKTKVSA